MFPQPQQQRFVPLSEDTPPGGSQPRRSQLRLQTILPLLILMVLLPFLGVRTYTAFQEYTEHYQQAENANHEVALAVSTTVRNYLHDILRQENALALVMAETDDPSVAWRHQLLVRAAQDAPAIRNYFWIGTDGTVAAASDLQALGRNVGALPAVREVMAGKEWAISDLYNSPFSGVPVFAVAQGYRSQNGRLRGVIMATIDPNRMGQLVSISRFQQGTLVISDSSGHLVYRVPEASPIRRIRQIPEPRPFLDQALQGHEATGVFPSPFDRVRRITSAIPITGTGWALVSTRPLHEVVGHVQDDAGRDVGVFLLVAGITLALALLVARRISSRIAQLQRHALALGRGELHHRLDVQGFVELEDLTSTLNGMAAELQQRSEERDRYQAQVEHERAYFAAAMDVLPIPLAFFQDGPTMLLSNEALDDFSAAHQIESPQDIALQLPDAAVPLPAEQWPMARALHGEVVDGQELLMLPPTGECIPVIAHAAPVSLDDRILAAVATFQDITPLKAADKAKDEFLATLSHELLTPVTSMLGWTQVAQDQENPPLTRQALEIVERNIRRQKRLVDDLLDVSRIIHGKITLSPEPVDLWKLAAQQVENMQRLAAERQIALSAQWPGTPLPVMADPARTAQAISNLLNNALKFTPAGGRVTVTVQHDGDFAVLEVCDTGRGIPEERLAQVFTPFHQVYPDAGAGGLGLGLALVKGFVELQGGAVTAASPGPGQGSTFTIALPLVVPAGTEAVPV